MKKMTNKDFQYVSCLGGIGDTVYLLSLLNAYKKQMNVTNVRFFIRINHEPILKMYQIDPKNIIIVDENKALLMQKMKYKKIHNYIYGHPIREVLFPENLLDLQGVTLLDLYKTCVFHIDVASKVEKPIPSYNILDKNNKCFIIAPSCVSTPPIGIIFWERLVEILRVEFPDHEIYTNVKDDNELVVKGTEALCTDLEELCYLAANSCCFISVRSGICDLLAMLGVNMIVLYPEESSVYKKYNFKEFHLFNDIDEYIVDFQTMHIVLEQILKTIREKYRGE